MRLCLKASASPLFIVTKKGQPFLPFNVLIQYADYFDISLDYILGRTYNLQGKLYGFQSKIFKDNIANAGTNRKVLCTHSPANAKLEEAILSIKGE